MRQRARSVHGKIILERALNDIIEPRYIDVQQFMMSTCHGHWNMSIPLGGETASFLFRRHLQHLLFVAAIPVPWQRGERTAYFFSDGHCYETNTDSKSSL